MEQKKGEESIGIEDENKDIIDSITSSVIEEESVGRDKVKRSFFKDLKYKGEVNKVPKLHR
jgi:hypothetical protein